MNARTNGRRPPYALLVAASLMWLAGAAFAVDELAVQAKEQVRLKRCGRDAESVTAALRLDDALAWSLTLAGVVPGGTTLAGSYANKGRRDQKADLELDAASLASLTARASALATGLCGAETGVDGLKIKSFKLARSRRRATFKLIATFSAATGKRGRLEIRGNGTIAMVPATTTTIATSSSTTLSPSTSSTAPQGSSTTTTTTVEPSTTSSEASTTTVETTSSTTTTTDFCLGKADDTPCLTDFNICSVDKCRDEVCTHDTLSPFPFCGSANGSPCDAENVCGLSNSGPLCADVKRSRFDYCQPLVPATYACNQDPGYVFCNGVQDACPPERRCRVGEACNGDAECATGSCVGGICADKAGMLQPCDSAQDCVSQLACYDGLCRGTIEVFCLTDEMCDPFLDLRCDITGLAHCRLGVGAPCQFDSQCFEAAKCDPGSGTCKLLTNQPCSANGDCLDAFCSCGRLQGNPLSCVPLGRCKLPPGHACTDDAECPDSFEFPGGRTIEDGICLDGTCKTTKRHGEVCETNPPGAFVPHLGDSPNDGLCGTGHCHPTTSIDCDFSADCPAGETCDRIEFCFKGAGGDAGPCTPEGEICGGPLNPEDYVCCRSLGGGCTTDTDCCALYMAPQRGCNHTGTCAVLVAQGGNCTTSADCRRQSGHAPLQCTNGTCQPPPLVLPAGSPCDPADVNVSHCDAGLACFDCRPEGLGYRCADATSPCCRSGGPDYDNCGEKTVGEFTYDNQCCGFKCHPADDDQHCGSCANDCTTNGGNACVTQPGQCLLDDVGVRCERQVDESICADVDPPAGYEVQCVSFGSPPVATCEFYVPITNWVEFTSLHNCEGYPDNAPCTGDGQCCGCTCSRADTSEAGLFNFTSGYQNTCDCN